MVGYLLDSVSYLGVGLLIWCAFMLIYEMMLKIKKRMISWMQRIGMLLIGLYAVVVFSITVSPMYGFSTHIDWQLVNFIPGQAYKNMSINPLNMWGNILMFVPFGCLIPILSRRFRNTGSIIFLGAGISFIIEFCQLFLGRGTDIDDLILNTVGTMLGYLLSILLLRVMPKLNVYTGITVKRAGKKVFRDKGPVLILLVVMLLSVIITGFYKRNQYMDAPIEQMAWSEEQKNEEQKNEEQKNEEQKNEKQKNEEQKNEEQKNEEQKNEEQRNEEQKNEEQRNEEQKSEDNAVTNEPVKNDKRFENISMQADAVCVINVTVGQEIYSVNSNKKIAPASTTKMLTALTTLAVCNIDEEVTVGNEINYVSLDASRAGLVEGNVLTIKQLLEGLLLPSGNDAAYVLAAYTGKKLADDMNLSTEKAIDLFVEKMNENAIAVGANHSNFVKPDGYDTQEQYTTADDLACIAINLINSDYANNILSEIVKEYKIRECFADGTDVTWYNSNKLIDPSSEYYYKNAIGLKTGSSSNAGKCLISAAYINNNLYIVVVMGDSESGRYEDTLNIYHVLEQ